MVKNMSLTMLYYYNLKEIIKKLPPNVSQTMDLSDDNVFNYATFSDLGSFYRPGLFRKDKYRLDIKLKDENFYNFIYETLVKFMKMANANELLLIYAMIAHHILEDEIQKYLSSRITVKDTYKRLTARIDRYYTKIFDDVDLSKKSIYSMFPNGFTYTKEMNEVISHPFIKIYSFLNTNNYFTNAMKAKKRHYKHKLYPKRLNLEVLNLDNKPWLFGEETYNYSLNEVILNAREKAFSQIKIINSYLFDKKDKEFNELFNITKE